MRNENVPEAACELVITRVFDAPRSLVFHAWTDPVHLAEWWGPQGYASTVSEMDVRPGGGFRLEMRGPDGAIYPCTGRFLEIVEPERIVISGPAECSHACGAGLPPRATVTVTLVETNGKTLLTLHTLFDTAEDRTAAADAGYHPGWISCLERLAKQFNAR